MSWTSDIPFMKCRSTCINRGIDEKICQMLDLPNKAIDLSEWEKIVHTILQSQRESRRSASSANTCSIKTPINRSSKRSNMAPSQQAISSKSADLNRTKSSNDGVTSKNHRRLRWLFGPRRIWRTRLDGKNHDCEILPRKQDPLFRHLPRHAGDGASNLPAMLPGPRRCQLNRNGSEQLRILSFRC